MKNFEIVDKYDRQNRLDRWIKVLFQVTKSIDNYYALECQDIIVPLGELDAQNEDSNEELIDLVKKVQKKILRDYIAKNINFDLYHNLSKRFNKQLK